jgi:hypothetical protein
MDSFRSVRWRRIGWEAGVLLCLAAAPCVAQSTSAAVFGTVLDSQGRTIGGAVVSAQSLGTAQRRTATSDLAGRFSLLGLPPGSYELRIEVPGFDAHVREIILTVAQEMRVSPVLYPARLREHVSIEGSPPLVEAFRTTLGHTIVRDELERLPVAARDFTSLALLTPGILPNQAGNLNASSGIVTAGQTGRSNTFLLDGASLDDTFQANPRGGVPLDAVREFAVFTDGYPAQYGQASGAIVSVVTRSGTNQYHGALRYLVRDDRLDATSPAARLLASSTAPPEVPFEQKIPAASAGGPIRRDRAFFFGAVEGTLVDSASVTTSPLLPRYRPIATSVNPWHSSRWQGFARADVALGRHQATMHFRLDRASGPGDLGGGNQAPETRNDGVLSDQEITVTARQAWSTEQNEFQSHVGRRHWAFDRGDHCISPCPSFVERRNSIILGAAPADGIRTRETYWQLRDAFTSIRESPFGDHAITVGANAMIIQGRFGGAANQNGTFHFETDTPFDPTQPSTYPVRYTQTIGNPDVDLGHTLVALFAQDRWRPMRNLTINAGVRWEHDSLRGVWQDWNNVAPRLGVAFTPPRSAATVLRASYGIYFDQTFEVIVRQYRQAEQSSQLFVVNPGYPDWSGFNPNGGRAVSERQPNARRLVELDTPSVQRATGGVQQSFGSLAVSIDAAWGRGRNLLVTFDANAPDASARRPDPRYQILRVVESRGHSWYRGLEAGLTKRYDDRCSLSVAYTLSSAERDTEEFDFTPQDQQNLAAERGPATSDVRHQLVGSGSLDLPFRARLGVLVTVRNGAPYNIITGRDDNRDGTANDRPSGVARNSARGDGPFQLDARIDKAFRLRGARIELSAEAFNLTNHANWLAYNGNQLNQTFGRPTAAGIARQVQLGAHVRF